MLRILLRRWYIVVLVTGIAVATTWQTFDMLPERYRATVILRLHALPEDGVELPYRLDYADRYMNSLATLAESEWMLAEIEQVNLDISDLTIETEIPSNTDLLKISALRSDPLAAAESANRIGRKITEISRLPGGLAEVTTPQQAEYVGGTTSTLAFHMFFPAETPTEPAGLNMPQSLVLAGVLGVIAGTILSLATLRPRTRAELGAEELRHKVAPVTPTGLKNTT